MPGPLALGSNEGVRRQCAPKGEMMEIWSTKYALTAGIKHHLSADKVSPTMVKYAQGCYLHNGDWHITAAAAMTRAEEMRQKRIVSLRKTLDKLESMSFDA